MESLNNNIIIMQYGGEISSTLMTFISCNYQHLTPLVCTICELGDGRLEIENVD